MSPLIFHRGPFRGSSNNHYHPEAVLKSTQSFATSLPEWTPQACNKIYQALISTLHHMLYLDMINFCEAERKSNSKLTAIEQRLRLKHKKPDWMKDQIRRYSLSYWPAPYNNRGQYLSLPKKLSTELRYAILTRLTSGMQYCTSHSVGKAFSRATATPSLMSPAQIFFRLGRSHTNKKAHL